MTLSDWMQSHQLSQAAAGKHLGVPSGTVCRWLKGDRTPSVTTALEIERKTAGAVSVSSWAEKPVPSKPKHRVVRRAGRRPSKQVPNRNQ